MTVDSLKGVTAVFPVPDVDAAASWFWDAYIQASGLQSLWERVSSLPGVHDPNGYVLVFAEQTIEGKP
jgi:hypothetical protein